MKVGVLIVSHYRLGEEMLQAFSSGIAGQIIMLNRQQKPFALPISFKGFSAALKEMLAKA